MNERGKIKLTMSGLRAIKQNGFTIVELLIVIVVIAILASITVVSYNGISQRARNTTRLAAVKQAEQAVQLAVVSNSAATVRDTLNVMSGGARIACVGTGHPDSVSGTPYCGRYQTSAPYASQSTSFNTLLQNSGSLPNMGTYQRVQASDGDVVTGPFLQLMTVDGTSRLVLEFNLEGQNEKCSTSPLVYGTSGSYTLTKPGSGADYSSTGSGVTECRYVVADI